MTDADGNTIENENIILSGTKGKQKNHRAKSRNILSDIFY